MESVEVVCTYCGEVVEVDKGVADKLNETTAFCCSQCAWGEDELILDGR